MDSFVPVRVIFDMDYITRVLLLRLGITVRPDEVGTAKVFVFSFLWYVYESPHAIAPQVIGSFLYDPVIAIVGKLPSHVLWLPSFSRCLQVGADVMLPSRFSFPVNSLRAQNRAQPAPADDLERHRATFHLFRG